MKKRKVLIPIFFVLLFFIVFGVTSFLWKTGWEHSSAESSTTLVDNQSGRTLLTVDTTFYNYRYDKEMYDHVRDQGVQSCYDGGVIPFGTFDNALSTYYRDNNVKVGIYAGNFYNYYGGLEGVGNKKIEFPGYYYFRWSANIANRHSPYNSVCQGIVSDTLDGFNIANVNSGTLMTVKNDGSGVVEMPYFKTDFLTTNKGNNVPIGAIREHVGFPFRYVTSGSKKGYYEFDSTKDVVRFKDMWTSQPSDNPTNDYYYYGSEGRLQYYYNEQFVYSKASTSPQFFPFNTPGTAQANLDYGYGIRFNIPFYLSDDGKVDGKNMVFEFSGDDDVWIFIDGNLVLDLGGQHGKATGTIDFGVEGNKARVTNSTVTFVNGSTDASATVMSDKILAEDTYVSSTTNEITITKGDTNKHVITVFYMERGMFESNFHMAFNFVPEGVPVPTATPSPTEAPTPSLIVSQTSDPSQGQGTTASPAPTQTPNHDDSLTIQNKMVFPTTTPDANDQTESKINSTFLETVKDLAEDDIFQYSIQNKGTEASVVQDSGIKYPSGKLTVRKNGKTDPTKQKTSYLSFGATPYVRVYFNLDSAKNLVSDNGQKSWGRSNIPHISADFNGWKHTPMEKYNNSLYYYDVLLGKPFKFTNGTGDCTSNDISCSADFNGRVFTVSALGDNSTLTHHNPDTTGDPPYPTSDSIIYSSGLPYKDAGTDVKKFTPTDATIFNNVSDTSYEITEAYLAPTSAPDSTESKKILLNSNTTSGITSSDGDFGLFYDDSATFRKQFTTSSKMKVVQKDTLLTPTRYPEESLSSSTSAQKALTTFCTPVVTRNTNDYYYTTVTAESKSADRTKTQSINVSYDGQYTYANAATIPADDPVDITQTFTNTIKTGSLTISKELKGNMDADSNHRYGFQVSFSNVFGGDSVETAYSGSYTLIAEDGAKTEKTTTTGLIVLQPNQKAIISGIPIGTSYQIQEKAADGSALDDGSVVSNIQTSYRAEIEDDSIFSPIYKETNTTAKITVTKSDRTISGVIPCRVVDASYGSEVNEFTEVHVSVAYTNQFGALSITKKIAGDVNNSAYYGTDANGIATKEYTFTITETTGGSNTVYNKDYFVYTYTYPNGPNMPPEIKQEKKTATNGIITLKEGQTAEIGDIHLTSSHTYTITETIEATDIFFVEALKVTAGTGQDISSDKTQIKTTLSSTNPAFDVVYSNRYSNAYLTIEKFVDTEYYSDKQYSIDKTYQDMTEARQSFIFTVKQYKTLIGAKGESDEKPEASFEIVLTMGQDEDENYMKKADDDKEKVDSTTCKYKLSKTVKVLANRYYRIEEDTNWSWKYNLANIDKSVHATDTKSMVDTNKQYIILKTYLDDINELEQKQSAGYVPIAKFYNLLNPDRTDIDGDTDSIPNIIKIQK